MTQKRAVLLVCDGPREDSLRPEWMSNLCRLMDDGRRFTAYGSAFIAIRGGFEPGLVHDGRNSAVDLTATILCPLGQPFDGMDSSPLPKCRNAGIVT